MKKILLFSCVVLFALSLQAQIAIDSVDFVQNVGQAWFTQSGDSITVNVGSSGGPNTWDFTSLPSLNDTSLYVLIEPSTAPHHDSFPTANLVELATDYYDTTYQYSNLSFDSFTTLGFATSYTFNRIDNGTVPLPINYLDTWQMSTFDTIVDSGSIVITISLTMNNTADAYGTVITPMGSFTCLRIKANFLEIYTGYLNGIPMYGDTTLNIMYSWFAENNPIIITIESEDGDTNPNFTIADEVELYAGFTTGVEENYVEDINNNYKIIYNNNICLLSYKNLINQEILLHDLLGREIWSDNISGNGTIELQVPNPGIYFLTGNNLKLNKKIVIIQ